MTKAQLEAENVCLRQQIEAWKKAAYHYQSLAADGVLRLRSGMSYFQAQNAYDKGLALVEKARKGHDG